MSDKIRIGILSFLLIAGSCLLAGTSEANGSRPMKTPRQAADFPSAVASGDLERVKELLSGGSDPNQKLSNGDSVLLLATAVGNTGIVRSLLKAGANVDHAGEAGWTPLMVAIFSKYRELTALLIANGADKKFTASDGVTPMVLALQSEDDELIALLAERSSGKPRLRAPSDEQMETILPCRIPDQKALLYVLGRSCIAAGGEVLDRPSTTPSDDEARLATGPLALLIASASGNLPKVRSLLAAGAKVNVTDTDGWTALIHATNNGHKEVVSELLNAGVNVNAKSNNGTTALLVATLTEMEGIAKGLIKWGASPYIATATGVSALDVARAKDKKNLVTLFLSKLPAACKSGGQGDGTKVRDQRLGVWIKCPPLPTSTDMLRAASAGRADLVRDLHDKGVSANATDSDGWSALMFAAAKGHGTVVAQLLKLGAEVNHQSDDGTTSLMAAVTNNHKDAVWRLQVFGANHYLKNKNNITAFIIADKKKLSEMLLLLGPPIPRECWSDKRTAKIDEVSIDCPETSSWTRIPASIYLLPSDTSQRYACYLYANPYISIFKDKNGRVTKRNTVERPYISINYHRFETGVGDKLKVGKEIVRILFTDSSQAPYIWNVFRAPHVGQIRFDSKDTNVANRHLRNYNWIEVTAIFDDGGTALYRYNSKGFTAAHKKLLRDCNFKWP